MVRLWKSVAFRLAVFCGVLVIGSITIFSAIFYFGTIRVLNQNIDRKINSISQRLSDKFETQGLEELHKEIDATLSDKLDVDTEIYYLAETDGRKIAGNLSDWKGLSSPLDQSIDRHVLRDGNPSSARLLLHRLTNGGLLIVGRDMKDINGITYLVWRTIGVGSAVALMLAIGGTILFRYLLQRRIGAIRKTFEEIEAGNLTKRIPLSGVGDEFDLLGNEMNRMLDRIQHLMEGVRHVSNAIAHNLRTPLGCIRGRLDEALRPGVETARLGHAAVFSIEQIDALIAVFDKLLQIAESESGNRRRPFQKVALREIVTNVVELYDAIAEEQGISLSTKIDGDPMTLGDKDLLASALANLLDNALKYGGRSVAINVRETPKVGTVSVMVQDDGPGIPPEERHKIPQRFHRLNQSVPGTGLGLSIVAAIAHLHGASLQLEDASPGLLASIVLPIAS